MGEVWGERPFSHSLVPLPCVLKCEGLFRLERVIAKDATHTKCEKNGKDGLTWHIASLQLQQLLNSSGVFFAVRCYTVYQPFRFIYSKRKQMQISLILTTSLYINNTLSFIRNRLKVYITFARCKCTLTFGLVLKSHLFTGIAFSELNWRRVTL